MKRLLPLALFAVASFASADIIITVGPGNIFGDENVLYNEDGLIADGALVQGITNQSDVIIDNYGAGEDLTTPPGGHARIEAQDGSFTALTISPHETNIYFSSLILNIDVVDDEGDGTVHFFIDGVDYGTFDLDATGENFFRFTTTNGSVFDELSFTTDVELNDVQQIRVGTAVPEPATMAALAVGALGLLRRRRKS